MSVGLRVKCPLFFSDLNENSISSADFRTINRFHENSISSADFRTINRFHENSISSADFRTINRFHENGISSADFRTINRFHENPSIGSRFVPCRRAGRGHAVAHLVEALRYKSEGGGFDS